MLLAVTGRIRNRITRALAKHGDALWDEIKLLIPWGLDPYPIVRKIEENVQEETAANAKKAEQE